MSAYFVKLYASILDSTVWLETLATKIVWITMLAMADAFGFVASSIPGLAKRAGVSRKDCEAALKVLAAPDPDSRTRDHEGRRIETVDGGWLIKNHRKYRDLRTDTQIATAERVRRYREKQKNGVTVTDVTPGNSAKRVSRAEVEVEANKEKTPTPAPDGADITPRLNGKKTSTVKPESDYTFMADLRPIWQEIYGGEIPPGSAKRLKSSVDKHGIEEVSRRLRVYCEATPAAFASVPKFVATFGAWDRTDTTTPKGLNLTAGEEETVNRLVDACSQGGLFSTINLKDFEQRRAALVETGDFTADEVASLGGMNRAFCSSACQRGDRAGLRRHVASLVFFRPAPEQERQPQANGSHRGVAGVGEPVISTNGARNGR